MKFTRGSYFVLSYIKLCQEKAGLIYEYLLGYVLKQPIVFLTKIFKKYSYLFKVFEHGSL